MKEKSQSQLYASIIIILVVNLTSRPKYLNEKVEASSHNDLTRL